MQRYEKRFVELVAAAAPPAEEARTAPTEAPTEALPAPQELKRHFNEAQIVEITMVSGFFNFWNRFVDSLQVDVEQRDVGKLFAKSVSIDPAAYLAYMQDCWWREEEPASTA